MYNKIILAGHLTRDIEIRYTQGGAAIGKTAIATTRKFKAANGEQKEETLFVDLTFFGRTAEIANQYLRKGSKVLVDGRLKLDQWKAQDGTGRSKHTVTVENLQMLGNKNDSDNSQHTQENSYSNPPAYEQEDVNGNRSPMAAPQASPNIPEIDVNEDEIPF